MLITSIIFSLGFLRIQLFQSAVSELLEKRGISYEGTFPGVHSLLSRDYVLNVGLNELSISWKKFIPVALCSGDIRLLLYFLANPCGTPQVAKNLKFEFWLETLHR